MSRRVVVTGLGAITPIGNNVEAFWNGLKEKKVGIGPITYFDTADYKAKLAGEVKDFDPKQYMDPKAAKRMEKFCQFAGNSQKRNPDRISHSCSQILRNHHPRQQTHAGQDSCKYASGISVF